MQFTSLTFCIFFVLVFVLYWGLGRRRWQNGLLILASYGFYAYWDYRFLALIIASTLVDYGVALGIERSSRRRVRRAYLLVSIAGNLGLLGFFKYFNFFTESLQAALTYIGWSVHPVTLSIILPVGISFYTFQTMSYSIDVYRGNMKATRSLLDYATYVAFFPQLVAGPIERGARLLPQFQRNRTFDRTHAVDGARLILWGVVKKMILADNLALTVDRVFDAPGDFAGTQLMVATVCFAFQIYCDFSAYSDIATGLARLMGIDLMRNFAYPYFSQDLGEFWRRWHISLSTWFRDYVYIPLGGNRVSRAKQARNVLVTFILSGLWHGASWNFIVWGAINGVGVLPTLLRRARTGLTVTDVPGGDRALPSVAIALRMGATFFVTGAAWVFFRARTLPEAMRILQTIGVDALHPATYTLRGLNLTLVGPLLVGFIFIEWCARRHNHPLHLVARWPRPIRWFLYSLMIWGALFLAPKSTNPFIYFQF